MKARESTQKVVMILSGFLLWACLLPGMIPLQRATPGPMPVMEKDADKVIEVLNSKNYVRLEALAKEQYTEADFSKPGTLTFNVKITDDKPTYFSYGWCTTTEEILKQNLEHIKPKLTFNNEDLGSDVVHPLTFTRGDGLVCVDYGVLMSEWPAGQYTLKAAATFDEKINDGLADYEAGDYVLEYNVTVDKAQNSSATASPSP